MTENPDDSSRGSSPLVSQMRRAAGSASLVWLLVAVIGAAGASSAAAQDIQPRRAWTTSRVTGSPEPPRPYVTEHVFPRLSFQQPVELLPIPGTNRLLVAELQGQIDSFVNEPQRAERNAFLDLKAHVPEMHHLYGLAFHPDFEENRQLFVCYVLPPGHEDGSRVSRFRVRQSDPPVVDPESEQVLITWPSGGHNGGCLRFGPDGYLYISTGDGVGPNPPDPHKSGQDVSNLLSSILRIDVDRRGQERPYRVPPDNPFVDLPEARPEVWAYGLRNPWRMSFDSVSGDLWVGDVGWELWEMIYRAVPGGNYGWSITEGPQTIDPDGPRGPTPILPPTVAHPHTEAASITGGYVYQGDRLAKLRGAYVYGDYETGKVWGLRLDKQGEVSWHKELAETPMQIICFGIGQRGELYLVDYAGSIHRLIPNPDADRPTKFPHRLSETGLFESVPEQIPASGVVPYRVRATMWQDGATSRRWIALPGRSRVDASRDTWTFPEDAVLVKTLSLPGSHGETVRLETQLLHFDGSNWHGYSYRWDESQQDAELVPAEGDEAVWQLGPPGKAGEDPKAVRWHHASRADCLRCHNMRSGPPLAFGPMHLAGGNSLDGSGNGALTRLEATGVLQDAPRQPEHEALVDPRRSEANLTRRARSYLHINCAHCHRKHAGGSVVSEMQYDLPLHKAQLLGAVPSQGDFGIDDARVIAPGDPGRSVLLYRIAKTGSGRMPRLGAQRVDSQGLALLTDWIAGMEAHGQQSEGPSEQPGSAIADWLRHRIDEGDAPKPQQFAERLRSPAEALRIALALDRSELPKEQQRRVAAAAAEHPEPIVRDLFERFLPEDQRRQRLGDRIDPQSILALEGDPERGEQLFFADSGAQCQQCHTVGRRGEALGPDLSEIGSQRSREELLRAMLEPSATIEPEYQTYLLITVDGRVATGLLTERTETHLTLRDANRRDTTVPTGDIDQLIAQPNSMMPDGQLRELTAQEAADLLAYLVQLRQDAPSATADQAETPP